LVAAWRAEAAVPETVPARSVAVAEAVVAVVSVVE